MKSPIELIAGSRKRLVIAVFIALVPLFAFALGAADYIRNSSDSPTTDLVLITSWMVLALGASYLVAILVGDFVFPRGWRDVNILGKRVDVHEADVELIGAATQNQTLPFAVIIVAVLACMVVSTHLATDGFLNWYARLGYVSSTLRGDNENQKVSAMKAMTRAQDDRLIAHTELLEAQLNASEPAVRLEAVWSLGEISRRMVRSLELMARGQKGGDWVRLLHKRLIGETRPKVAKVCGENPKVELARACVYFMGSIRAKSAFPLFESLLSQKNKALSIDIVMAIASTREQLKGVPLLRPLLNDAEEEIAIAAMWAMGELYGFGTGDEDEDPVDPKVIEAFVDRMPSMSFESQCIALETTQRLRAADFGPVLFKLFDNITPADKRCERRQLERPYQAPVVIDPGEEFRQKVVKSLATIAHQNAEVLDWMNKRRRDESLASGLRDDMSHILKVSHERPID